MKLFENIQELWDHCTFCPVCQEHCRDVHVSVGPDETFELDSYDKTKERLDINCSFTKRLNVYQLTCHIDCQNNFFSWQLNNVQVINPSAHALTLEKIEDVYFYFYISGRCRKCQSTIASSLDIELNPEDKSVFNIGLERESVSLHKEADWFHISIHYDSDVMYVSKVGKDGNFVDGDKFIKLPIVKLDFANPGKIFNKIKTLILFS